MMEKITSYLIAVGLIGFGAWIVTAEARSNTRIRDCNRHHSRGDRASEHVRRA